MTSTARTMRAMHAAGPDPASLTCERIPVPSPGPGELLVGVGVTAVITVTCPSIGTGAACVQMRPKGGGNMAQDCG